MNISGVVLAGGENRRFKGETKANLIVDGQSIIENTLAVLTGIFDDVIIVTNRSSDFTGYSNFRQIPDIFRGVGPLGGIHAVLSATSSDAIFVTASDMPHISSDIICDLVNHFRQSDCEVLIPRLESFDEPLHAIYSISVLDRLNNFLMETKKYAIRDFLTITKVEYLAISKNKGVDKAFTNINTPEDLNNLKKS